MASAGSVAEDRCKEAASIFVSVCQEQMRPERGRCLVSTQNITEGDLILVERPVAVAQFAWNEACGYRACGWCLRSLETAAEMFTRLAALPSPPALPHPECCSSTPELSVKCKEGCAAQYCTEDCRNSAWQQHHKYLCTEGPHGGRVAKLYEAWREFHQPPETTSIGLLCQIVVAVGNATDGQKETTEDPFENTPFSAFCREVELEGGFKHKTLDDGWAASIDHIRLLMLELFTEVFPGSAAVARLLAPSGFMAMMALVGRNGAGVGTSAIAAYDAKATALEMPDAERDDMDALLNGLYEAMDAESGEFLDCEGSGLFSIQSACNHACVPNAQYSFPNNSAELHLTALEDIAAGDEITISYLDPCAVSKSRNYRQSELGRSYLFACDCQKCVDQIDCPDQSDEDEDNEEEEDEEGEGED